MLTKAHYLFPTSIFCQKEISRLHVIVKHLEYMFHLLEHLYQLSVITNDDKKLLFKMFRTPVGYLPSGKTEDMQRLLVTKFFIYLYLHFKRVIAFFNTSCCISILYISL